MFAQSLAGGESLTTQPKVLIVSIDNLASLIYFKRFSAFYGLRPRLKPPHPVSWFHSLLFSVILLHPSFRLPNPGVILMELLILRLTFRKAIRTEKCCGWIGLMFCYMPAVMEKPLYMEHSRCATIRLQQLSIFLAIHVRNLKFLTARVAFDFSYTGVHPIFFSQFFDRHITQLLRLSFSRDDLLTRSRYS